MRLIHLIISTGLTTIMAGGVALPGVAKAATMDPREVTQMLARSQALDSHCKFLSSGESQDLRDLVAKAEIALAAKYSVAIARETLAKGRADGKIAVCDVSASAQVKDMLKAGLQATTQMIVKPVTEPAPAAPASERAPEKAVKVMPAVESAAKPQMADASTTPRATPTVEIKKLTAKKRTVAQIAAKAGALNKQPKTIVVQTDIQMTTQVKTKRKVSLASYSNLAEKYYVELKCRTMPISRAQHMYEDVLAQHRAAMASDGAPAVRRLLRSAQSRASAQSCG